MAYSKIINRQYPLSADYVPPDLVECIFPFQAPWDDPKRCLRKEAAEAAHRLFDQARCSGMMLYGISGYRSYARQQEIYQQRLKETSQSHVDSYIALPGTSEHQSGLALDVSCLAVHLELVEEFAATREGQWLVSHAPLFGYILRYPQDKTKITGYAWEPWHIRYVTKPLSLYLSLTNLTLEEFHQM